MLSVSERRMRAARARAARAYAGLSQPKLAGLLQTSVETLSRLENARKTEITIEELWAIADACGVPRSFMEFGFEVVADAGERALISGESGDVFERLTVLEDQVRQLVTRDARRELEERQQTGGAREPASPPRPQQRRTAPGGQPRSGGS